MLEQEGRKEQAGPLNNQTWQGLSSVDFSGGQIGLEGKWGFQTVRKVDSLDQLNRWPWPSDLRCFNLPCLVDHKWDVQPHSSLSSAELNPNNDVTFALISSSKPWVTLLNACTYWPFYVKKEMSLIKCRAARARCGIVSLRWKSPGNRAGIY